MLAQAHLGFLRPIAFQLKALVGCDGSNAILETCPLVRAREGGSARRRTAMAILVTGGAGYIGGVTVELLHTKGERVVVLDDLAHGHRETLDAGIPFH
jgi:NADPH:quinone reductase-like Zn-dependent oxidoreductase